MPYSDPTNKSWTIEQIIKRNPNSILDVGAGAGTYGTMLLDAGYRGQLDALEVWEPYVKRFGLSQIYDAVIVGDVRGEVVEYFDEYEMIIFGDVLEHMSKADALLVWGRVWNDAVISIPTIHYPQGAEEGNPYEEHVEDHWTEQDVLDTFAGIKTHKNFGVTGVFLTWKS